MWTEVHAPVGGIATVTAFPGNDGEKVAEKNVIASRRRGNLHQLFSSFMRLPQSLRSLAMTGFRC